MSSTRILILIKNNVFYICTYFIAYTNYRIFPCTYTYKSNTYSFLLPSQLGCYYFHFSSEESVTQRTLTVCLSSCVYSFNKYLFSPYAKFYMRKWELHNYSPQKVLNECMVKLELNPGFQALGP